MKQIIIFGLFIVFTSCVKNDEVLPEMYDTLLGNWTNMEWNESYVSYKKTEVMPTDNYAFNFGKENKFSEHKNAGWCGTPPITYGNFNGTWSLNDSVITIKSTYWGGYANYEWKIISIDNNNLKIKIIKEEYQK